MTNLSRNDCGLCLDPNSACPYHDLEAGTAIVFPEGPPASEKETPAAGSQRVVPPAPTFSADGSPRRRATPLSHAYYRTGYATDTSGVAVWGPWQPYLGGGWIFW